MFGGELKNVTILFEPSILSDIFDRFGDDIKIVRLLPLWNYVSR